MSNISTLDVTPILKEQYGNPKGSDNPSFQKKTRKFKRLREHLKRGSVYKK